jgi:hypothetical protein
MAKTLFMLQLAFRQPSNSPSVNPAPQLPYHSARTSVLNRHLNADLREPVNQLRHTPSNPSLWVSESGP